MRIVRAAVAAILVLLIVIFALSNRQPVEVGFWPTGYVWTVPLSLAVLAVSALFFIGGALLGWRGASSVRRRARRAEAALRVVEAQRPVPSNAPLLAPPGS